MESKNAESHCVPASSKLFEYSPIDKKEDIDETLEHCYATWSSLGKNDSTGKQINQYVLLGRKEHDEICFGLLYSILTEPSTAAEHYRDMLLYNMDQLDAVALVCSHLITGHFDRFPDSVKCQICWVIEQSAKTGVKRLSTLIFPLLRELQRCSLEVVDRVLRFLEQNVSWICGTTLLSSTVVYTLIHILPDHQHASPELHDREAKLCVYLIRSRWTECARIGRDFLRAIQSVCGLPAFAELWQDILAQKLSGQKESPVDGILFQRTQRKFLLSRLTHDLERKLFFLIHEVRCCEELAYYQDWLNRELSSSNRIDMIRYLCSAYQPPDDQPIFEQVRRNTICWLMATCESINDLDRINARMAFVFDWLVYRQERRQMIDPQVARGFDWVSPLLSNLAKHFFSPLSDKLSHCVSNFLKAASLERAAHRIEEELVVGEEPFYNGECDFAEDEPVAGAVSEPIHLTDETEDDNAAFSSSEEGQEEEEENDEFEEEEEECQPEAIDKHSNRLYTGPVNPFTRQDAMDLIAQVPATCRTAAEQLLTEKSKQARQHLIDFILNKMDGNNNHEAVRAVASLLLFVLRHSVPRPILPDKDVSTQHVLQPPGQDNKLDARLSARLISRPLFSLFERSCPNSSLFTVLKTMHALQPRLGYLFLLYLRLTSSNASDKFELYRNLFDVKDREKALERDLVNCHRDESLLFYYLLSFVCRQIRSNPCLNNGTITRLVAGSASPCQLAQLKCRLAVGELFLFSSQHLSRLIKQSGHWTPTEQSNLWLLLRSQIAVRDLSKYFATFDADKLPIAVSNIMELLSLSLPAARLLEAVLARQPPDLFSLTVLTEWCNKQSTTLVDSFVRLLQRLCPAKGKKTARQSKRKISDSESSASVEDAGVGLKVSDVLRHVDCLRLSSNSNCLRFLLNDSVCSSLSQVAESMTDLDEKEPFEELFQLTKDFAENSKTRTRPRRTSQSKEPPPSSDDSDSSSDHAPTKAAARSKPAAYQQVDHYGWKPSIRTSASDSLSAPVNFPFDRSKSCTNRHS